MSDLINRSTLLEEVKSLTVTVMGLRAGKGVLHEYAKQYRDTLLRIINEQPTIEAVPVVHGEWIYENYTWHCGVCGFHPFKGYIPKTPGFNFCPNCGASMNGGIQNSFRDRIIDEFAQKAIERLEDMGCEAWRRDIMAIAEEMKGVE